MGTLAYLFSDCWTANVRRIVDTVTETNRFGFAYGTLKGYLLRGEARLLVEYDPADGSVWFDILACFRPVHWAAWLGYPIVRGFQRCLRAPRQQRWRWPSWDWPSRGRTVQ